MNVLLLTPKYPPDTGGAAQYFELLAATLKSRGHAVRVVAARAEAPERSQPDPAVHRWLPITHPRRAIAPRVVEGVWRQAAILWALRWAKSRGAVVHVHNSLASPVVGTFGRRWNLDLVVDLRDHRRIPDPAGYRGALGVSEELAAEARARGFCARAVPLPVSPDLPPRRSDGARRTILFAGQITEAKGARRFLDAVKVLDESGWLQEWNGKAVLAGQDVEGWRPEESERIRYAGALAHTDLVNLMAGAALLVLPSDTEGIPRVVAEATVLGVPVLVHGSDDLGPNAAASLLGPADLEPESLARRIQAAIADPPPVPDLADRVCRAEEFGDRLAEAYGAFGIAL